MKLLLATTNPAKLEELSMFLSDLSLDLLSLKEAGIKEKAKETGKTFEANAVIKARFYARKAGVLTLADDGGFEIDVFGGKPGVLSHRWGDPDKEFSDEELIGFTFEKMKKVPPDKRGAQLRVVLALAQPDGTVVATVEQTIRGIVPDKPSPARQPGFPYRSILFLPQIRKFYNQKFLTKKETEEYNHRRRALEEIKPHIEKFLHEEA